MLAVGTKLDMMQETEASDALRAHVTAKGFEYFTVSSLEGTGMRELLRRVEAMVLKPVDGSIDEDDDELEEDA